ncbi:MAG: hypothetical protein R3324_06650 [Halobacteriales archaeon]|nr:hypothetical protein [Halobacteriales archaeon]
MGLLDRVAEMLEVPYAALYECSNCESRVEGFDSSCPECGEEIEASQPEASVFYWGYM